METITYKEKFIQFNNIFHALNDSIKWKADRRILMMIASIYTTNNHPFDLELFKSMSDFIKKEVGFFSPLRTHYRYTVAAILIVNHNEPVAYFKNFQTIYQTLIKNGFKRNAFTVIAALSLVMESKGSIIEHELVKKRAKKGISLYKAMRSEHFFLTSASDYPLALLLSKSEQDVDTIIRDIEYFYHTLSNHQLKKGNDLQFLSHILMINNQLAKDKVVKNCQSTYELLTNNGIKIKRIHYPTIGLLSMIKDGEQLIDSIKLLHTHLNNEKKFRYYKDLNFMIAVSLIISDYIDQPALTETNMTTSIHTIIEAQTAASIAAISAASAASAASAST